MDKKSLLSYTAAVVIILFNTHSPAPAKSFSAGKGENKTAQTGENYENVFALEGGKIHGKNLKITGLSIQEESIKKDISGAEARETGSIIELEGDTIIKNVATGLWAQENGTIKMSGGSIYTRKMNLRTPIGIESVLNGAIELKNVEIEISDKDQNTTVVDGTGAGIKNGGTLSMTGGSIKTNYQGIIFEDSNSDKNELKNVKIDITGPVTAPEESIGISAIQKSKVTLKKVKITNARTSIHASDNSQVTISGGSIQGSHTGIYVEKESVVTLKNDVEVLSNDCGLSANGLQSKIIMTGGTLTTIGSNPTALAGSGGKIILTDVVVHTTGNEKETETETLLEKDAPLTTQGLEAQYLQSKIIMIRGSITTTGINPAVLAGSGGQLNLTDVSMNARNVGLQAQGEQSKIIMKRGSITTTGINPAVLAGSGGQINLTNVSIKTNDIGLQAQNKQSQITMKGGRLLKTGPRSAVFATCSGQINITDAHIYTDSNGLTVRGKQSKITLKDSEVHANILLIGPPNEEDSGESSIIADHSILEGGARDSEKNPTQTLFSLINGTTWYLKAPTKNNNNEKTDLIEKLHSAVFMLNLNNSTIVFKDPTEDQYQTLHIGTKTPHAISKSTMNEKAYSANGNAKIYFNLKWSDGAPKEQQKTDRLLIHGNVSGTTMVHFQKILKDDNTKADNSVPLNQRGISLIQVSGKANENAFKLANGYTIIAGLPYKYTLNAYGPTSNRGKASVEQNLVGEEENFWDFRLQNAILDSEETTSLDPEEKIRALVPQVASYLVMPQALFSAGLSDVSNQNALLNNMQTILFGPENHKKKGLFLSSYGNKAILSSSRNPLQYGYGADVRYAALQAGVTLSALEGQNIATDFGLLGTYGKLAFTPKGMEGAGKSVLDKWSLTAYGSIQHDNGIYLDTFFSYGTVKGNITTALIGNTTKLNNTKTLSASATVGQKLATHVKGVVFEPQAQLIYQRLMFGILSDVDGFEVNMGKPHQWLVRVGGRLTQNVFNMSKNRAVSFYGKVNVIKAFGDNGTIKIGDAFQLDSMGGLVEGGLGVNAQFSQNIVLHADVNYQQKLQKSGVSGMYLSGAISYHF
ncbi:autotransporter outer membrane beta-barrel domain-containing protein [Candidatus Bartonella washoeensis]|uniref:Outer membrane autotransporter barrel domain-containing protein n=1 Tax=Cardidatus Bartonella washoeensis 085-0475 TaxID=1094564 RepID=J1JPC3_9HYPH|nr:autotransporter outer membrane beta-barrel domain-containing protein [Bartonella washoeensis]EJF86190.1 outer membrane autotransporter barrel domain-containing protein [Bartonella washoeensis 085-0475]